jgi:prepilin-type N-terminal cleavage/methylation domain-containing protein
LAGLAKSSPYSQILGGDIALEHRLKYDISISYSLLCYCVPSESKSSTLANLFSNFMPTPQFSAAKFPPRRFQRGFTLVELLVVIAIIGVLVSLLLPAVQKVRESARRTQCSNHLKQMGIAILSHVDQFKSMPHAGEHWSFAPDYDTTGSPQVGEAQRAGWGFQLLPFLEQANVWNGAGKATNDDRQIQAVGARIPGYFCPSRRSPQFYTRASWYGPTNLLDHGLMDYASSSDETNNTWGVVVRNASTTRDMIPLEQVIDGTSNTFVISEKRLNRARLSSDWVGDDNEGYTSGWDHDTIRFANRQPRPDYTNQSGGDGEVRFGSSHDGGFNTLSCDGSVRYLSYNIDLALFRSFGDRRDGQAIALP